MNFNRDEDAKLIELVAGHRELYDCTHKDYKNIVLRDNIWEEIASHLENKTDENCKKRWRSIRDTWKRLKRGNKLGSGSAAHTKRPWPLAPYLEFLSYVELERRAVGNILQNAAPKNRDTLEEAEAEEEVEELSQYNSAGNEEETVDSVTTIEESSTPSTSMHSIAMRRNRPQRDHLSQLLQQSKEERDKLIETLNKSESENEVDLFYKSLALSVKRLPQHLQSQAKLRHLQTVTELEIQAANEGYNFSDVMLITNPPRVTQL